MIYYTKYAEEKFGVLREHKFSLTKEDVENVLNKPSKVKKFDKRLWQVEGGLSDEYGIKVIYRKDGDVKRVITFYPTRK